MTSAASVKSRLAKRRSISVLLSAAARGAKARNRSRTRCSRGTPPVYTRPTKDAAPSPRLAISPARRTSELLVTTYMCVCMYVYVYDRSIYLCV